MCGHMWHWGVGWLFLSCGPEDWTKDVRVGSKHLYPLSHFTGSNLIYTLLLQIFFYSFYFVINFIIENYSKNHTPKLTRHKSHVNKLLTVRSILNCFSLVLNFTPSLSNTFSCTYTAPETKAPWQSYDEKSNWICIFIHNSCSLPASVIPYLLIILFIYILLARFLIWGRHDFFLSDTVVCH